MNWQQPVCETGNAGMSLRPQVDDIRRVKSVCHCAFIDDFERTVSIESCCPPNHFFTIGKFDSHSSPDGVNPRSVKVIELFWGERQEFVECAQHVPKHLDDLVSGCRLRTD